MLQSESIIHIHKLFTKNNLVYSAAVANCIAKYCGGIPEIADHIFNYYNLHNRLPALDSTDDFKFGYSIMSIILERLYEATYNYSEARNIIIAIFSTGKTIDKFFKAMQNNPTADALYLQQLGIDMIIVSPYIRMVFESFVGKDILEKFLSSTFTRFLNDKLKKIRTGTNMD